MGGTWRMTPPCICTYIGTSKDDGVSRKYMNYNWHLTSPVVLPPSARSAFWKLSLGANKAVAWEGIEGRMIVVSEKKMAWGCSGVDRHWLRVPASLPQSATTTFSLLSSRVKNSLWEEVGQTMEKRHRKAETATSSRWVFISGEIPDPQDQWI